MTVQDQTIATGDYAGNDVADTFDFSWQINDKSQVVVSTTDTETGVTTVLDEGSVNDYTVSGVGDEGGGSITLTAGALPLGTTLRMRSNFAPTQLVEFASQGSFLPENHEFAYDKLTRLIQQLVYNGEFTLRFDNDTTINTFNPELPTPDVALGFLRINESLTALEWVTNQGGIDLSQDFNFTGGLQHNGYDVINRTNLPDESFVYPISETGTTRTLGKELVSRALVCTNAGAITLTVPEDILPVEDDFEVGTILSVYQAGTGQITFAPENGNVTIENRASEGLRTSEQFGWATLWKRDANTWVLTGSLTA